MCSGLVVYIPRHLLPPKLKMISILLQKILPTGCGGKLKDIGIENCNKHMQTII